MGCKGRKGGSKNWKIGGTLFIRLALFDREKLARGPRNTNDDDDDDDDDDDGAGQKFQNC